jgi:hypothetical protein
MPLRSPGDTLPDADDLAGPGDSLTDDIIRRIENATCGRVSGLYVARLGEAIVLHGYCRTYHARELAHQAALDTAGGAVPLIDLLTVS